MISPIYFSPVMNKNIPMTIISINIVTLINFILRRIYPSPRFKLYKRPNLFSSFFLADSSFFAKANPTPPMIKMRPEKSITI